MVLIRFVVPPNYCVLMVKICCNQSVGLLGETLAKQMISPQQMWGNVEMEPRMCQVVSKRKTDSLSFFSPTVNQL